MENLRGLHVLTDREAVKSRSLAEIIQLAIAGGAAAIQLRDKDVEDLSMIKLGEELMKLTKGKVPLIVDDRVEVALAIGADGVHVGQKDMPARAVRKKIGSGKILGVSAHSVREAVQAEEDGADYIGAGPVFPTKTKKDAETPIGLTGLRQIKNAVSIPIIAIGGIKTDNAAVVMEIADGIAVISAVLRATFPLKATQTLVSIINYEKSRRRNINR